eukprot:765260-Hanusia_phi.AAC.9
MTPKSGKRVTRESEPVLLSSRSKLRESVEQGEALMGDVNLDGDVHDLTRAPTPTPGNDPVGAPESSSPELDDLARPRSWWKQDDWNWGAVDWENSARQELEMNYNQGESRQQQEEEEEDEIPQQEATFWEPWHRSEVSGRLIERGQGEESGGLAELAYERALASDPTNFDTLVNFANYLYVKKRNVSRAVGLYELAVIQEPNNVPTLSNYGRLLQEMGGDDAQVKQIFQRVLDLDPQNVRVLEQMAILSLTKEKDLAKSQLYYEASLEADERSALKRKLTAESLCTYAGLLEDLHRHAEAASVYEKALMRNPKHVASLFNYGLMLETALKKPANAADMYSRILKIDPQHHLTLCNYGGLLESVLHDYVTAELMYVRALALKPDDANTLYNYAGLLEDFRKDPAGALAMYEKALEDQPEHAPSLFAMARLQWTNRSAESDSIRRQLEHALQVRLLLFLCLSSPHLKIDPHHIGSLNLLSRITVAQDGDVQKGKYLVKQALLLDPNNLDAINTFGEFCLLECFTGIEDYDWRPLVATDDLILLSTKYPHWRKTRRKNFASVSPSDLQ